MASSFQCNAFQLDAFENNVAFQPDAFQKDAFQTCYNGNVIVGYIATIQQREITDAIGELSLEGYIETISQHERTDAIGIAPAPSGGGASARDAVAWIPAREPKYAYGRAETNQKRQFSSGIGTVTYKPIVIGKISTSSKRQASSGKGFVDDSDEDILAIIMQSIED